MKSEFINIRISATFKADLEILSNLKEMSLSNLGREALNEYYNNTSLEVDLTSEIKEESPEVNGSSLLQSLSFSELIFWLYEKKHNPEINEIDEFHQQHVDLIQEMHSHPKFNREILKEFNKVHSELSEWLSQDLFNKNRWLFSDSKESNGFNYSKLANFMYNIRYSEDQMKNLFIK